MKKTNPKLLTTSLAITTLWLVSILLFAIASNNGSNGTVNGLLALVLFIAITVTAFALMFARKRLANSERTTKVSMVLAKLLALSIPALLITSTLTAIKSLWITSLSVNYADKFVYENIATGTILAAVFCILLLGALQKDRYWVSRNKLRKFDERQLQERQQVFEKSYWFATIIIVAWVYIFSGYSYDIPVFIANNHGTPPGHLYVPAHSLVLAVISLPQIIGAWKKK